MSELSDAIRQRAYERLNSKGYLFADELKEMVEEAGGDWPSTLVDEKILLLQKETERVFE